MWSALSDAVSSTTIAASVAYATDEIASAAKIGSASGIGRSSSSAWCDCIGRPTKRRRARRGGSTGGPGRAVLLGRAHRANGRAPAGRVRRLRGAAGGADPGRPGRRRLEDERLRRRVGEEPRELLLGEAAAAVHRAPARRCGRTARPPRAAAARGSASGPSRSARRRRRRPAARRARPPRAAASRSSPRPASASPRRSAAARSAGTRARAPPPPPGRSGSPRTSTVASSRPGERHENAAGARGHREALRRPPADQRDGERGREPDRDGEQDDVERAHRTASGRSARSATTRMSTPGSSRTSAETSEPRRISRRRLSSGVPTKT